MSAERCDGRVGEVLATGVRGLTSGDRGEIAGGKRKIAGEKWLKKIAGV